MPTTYRARYWSTDPSTPLLGGVMASRSSAFDAREDAELRLESALEINRAAGRPCDGEILETNDRAEILHHECAPGRFSSHSQARGCKCPSCGHVV